MQNIEPIKHHEFSPSRLEKYAVCPWSYKNCIGWVSESGQDAERGTLMHRAVYEDEALNQLNDRDKEVILKIREEHIEPYKNLEHYHELYVEVKDDEGSILTAGYIDDLVISPDGLSASVKDYKFGNQPVSPAENNDQLIPYVAGTFQKFPKLVQIFGMIVQPIFELDYDKQAVFKREQLPELLTRIRNNRKRAENATEEDAHINPYCKYCNREHCRKYRQQMESNMELLAIDRGTELLTDQDIEMTIDYADRLLCAKRQIESVMEDKAEKAKQVILDAGGSQNFKVMAGKTSRRTDWKKLAADKGITDEEIAGYTTESVGESYIAPKMRMARKRTDKLLPGK